MQHIILTSLILVTASVALVSSDQIELSVTEIASNYTNVNTEDDKLFSAWWQQFFGSKPPTTTQLPSESLQPNTCAQCKCGLTNKIRRIVGGISTQVNEYPWMALLMHRGRFYCGATVINSRYVLTAAHCAVDRFDKNSIIVRILEHDRNSTSETEVQDFRVLEVIRHESYSTVNFDNDISLIRIKGEFDLRGRMRPVCLPVEGETFSGKMGIVTGWGAIKQSGPVSSVLQEVQVPIMSNEQCRQTKYPARKITDNMLCAGHKEGAKDSCQGDSGGPLHVVNDEAVHSIVGVVSWGEGCAQPNYPGVYARVNRFLSWIERNTADACYC